MPTDTVMYNVYGYIHIMIFIPNYIIGDSVIIFTVAVVCIINDL